MWQPAKYAAAKRESDVAKMGDWTARPHQ
jgi:hypothetical protein